MLVHMKDSEFEYLRKLEAIVRDLAEVKKSDIIVTYDHGRSYYCTLCSAEQSEPGELAHRGPCPWLRAKKVLDSKP